MHVREWRTTSTHRLYVAWLKPDTGSRGMDLTFNRVDDCPILDTCQLWRKLFGVLYGMQFVFFTLSQSIGKHVKNREMK